MTRRRRGALLAPLPVAAGSGKAVEAVFGQRLDAYLQDRVLGPLGMRDTMFRIGESQPARGVAGVLVTQILPFADPRVLRCWSGSRRRSMPVWTSPRRREVAVG